MAFMLCENLLRFVRILLLFSVGQICLAYGHAQQQSRSRALKLERANGPQTSYVGSQTVN